MSTGTPVAPSKSRLEVRHKGSPMRTDLKFVEDEFRAMRLPTPTTIDGARSWLFRTNTQIGSVSRDISLGRPHYKRDMSGEELASWNSRATFFLESKKKLKDVLVRWIEVKSADLFKAELGISDDDPYTLLAACSKLFATLREDPEFYFEPQEERLVFLVDKAVGKVPEPTKST